MEDFNLGKKDRLSESVEILRKKERKKARKSRPYAMHGTRIATGSNFFVIGYSRNRKFLIQVERTYTRCTECSNQSKYGRQMEHMCICGRRAPIGSTKQTDKVVIEEKRE